MRVLVGIYAWTVTLAFGAAVLDVVYAAQLRGGSTAGAGEAADALLGLTALAVLVGVGAIAASWDRKPAVALLVASLAIILVGLPAAALLAGVVGDVEQASGVRVGPWLRLGGGGLASVLAFAGLWASWRRD